MGTRLYLKKYNPEVFFKSKKNSPEDVKEFFVQAVVRYICSLLYCKETENKQIMENAKTPALRAEGAGDVKE